MAHILILGAGRQGTAAAYDLIRDGHEITLVDRREDAVARSLKFLGLKASRGWAVDLTRRDQLMPLFQTVDGAVFAADYSLNLELTQIAIETSTHAIDFGGNNDIVADQLSLEEQAQAAGITVIPDVGLTPGLAGVLVAGGIERLGGRARSAEIRVGGLPLDPQPPLNYALVFSVRGLINEYIEPSLVMEDGEVKRVPSMSAVESLRFGDRTFEAFLTSGGTSTLPQSFAGRLENLDCKTIRYPGHCEIFRTLFALGFGASDRIEGSQGTVVPRVALETVLEHRLPHDPPDEVLMRVTVQGEDGARLEYEMRDEYDRAAGLSAMQRTTAWPGTCILNMVLDGRIAERGVLYQERVVDAEELIRELGQRGIKIETKSTQSDPSERKSEKRSLLL